MTKGAGENGNVAACRPPKLVVTIDTEEDNWGEYSGVGATLTNIERIPRLQGIFDTFNVKPTYLVTYPVATSKQAVSLLKAICDDGRCEIGTHLHPWNTPPFRKGEYVNESMLCNLPPELQEEKVACLHDAIRTHFTLTPSSFRAGRWAYNESVHKVLGRLGYRVDTSVTPFTSWAAYGGPDFSKVPLRRPGIGMAWAGIMAAGDGPIEIPATIGFLQNNFTRCNRICTLIDSTGLRNLHLKGILARLHLLNKAWLSPEVSGAASMIRLSRLLTGQGYALINMFFHSTSLKAGLSPFVRTSAEEELFFDTIREFLAFARSSGIESVTLSQAVRIPSEEQAQ